MQGHLVFLSTQSSTWSMALTLSLTHGYHMQLVTSPAPLPGIMNTLMIAIASLNEREKKSDVCRSILSFARIGQNSTALTCLRSQKRQRYNSKVSYLEYIISLALSLSRFFPSFSNQRGTKVWCQVELNEKYSTAKRPFFAGRRIVVVVVDIDVSLMRSKNLHLIRRFLIISGGGGGED